MVKQEVSLLVKSKKPRFFYGYVIVVAGVLAMIVMYGTQYSFGIFFKPVLTEFGWTRAETSGAYSLFMILQGIFCIITGRLTDRFGPRLVITGSGLFLGLGYILMSQIGAIWQLYLFYGLLAGIGMGGWVPLLSIVARWFIKRRGLMSGIVVSGVGIGTIAMPPIANQLIFSYSWRTSYIIIGSVALAVMVVTAQFLKREPSEMGQLPYGADKAEVVSSDSEARAFSVREAIRTRQFWIVSAVYFSFLFCIQTTMVHIAPHATDIGISAIGAASILSVIGALSIFGRLGMGSAGDRVGNRRSLVIVLILMAIAIFWLQFARELWMFYFFALIFGFGYGGSVAVESPLVADFFGLKSHGAIFGVIVFIALIGGATGPLVAGRIFDITDSYRLAFLVGAVLITAALILAALFLKPIRRQV